MILRDLIDLARKEKRMKERVKAARKFAVGMGAAATVGVGIGIILAPKAGKETRVDLKKKAVNTLETVRKKAETMKDSAAHAAYEVCNVIKDVHEKAEDEKKDILD
jgi:gas vesicle protein